MILPMIEVPGRMHTLLMQKDSVAKLRYSIFQLDEDVGVIRDSFVQLHRSRATLRQRG